MAGKIPGLASGYLAMGMTNGSASLTDRAPVETLKIRSFDMPGATLPSADPGCRSMIWHDKRPELWVAVQCAHRLSGII